MKIFGLTHIGNVRELNEDYIVFNSFPDGAVYAAVCDGMGGANAGEVASETAAKRFEENILKNYSAEYNSSNIRNLLNASVNIANYAVFDKAQVNKGYSGMGTTLVSVIVKETEAVIVNVGDSRAYKIGDEIKKITIDHSFVQDLVNKGEITEADAENHPDKNIITRALGAEERVTADFYFETLEEGETLLLCSDGLSGLVKEEDMRTLSKIADIEKAAEALIDNALLMGGNDNISVILIRN